MSSYIGYPRDKRIIAYDIVERDSIQNCASRKQVTTKWWCMHPLHFEHLSKKGAKAGSCTLDRTMKRMGSNLYANCFSGIVSCVFERFVFFAFRQNYLANYVQKLR